MLSIANVSGGAAASGYYTAEGYYIDGSKEAEGIAQYFGSAATEAGLVGQVDEARFANLLDGETPSGKRMGRVLADGTHQHRHGIDLTFSAPKGVSIAGLVFGDERVLTAHTEAVKTALTYVEDNLLETRTKRGGEMTIHKGGKMIAGLFQHDTSRALDPQLHTHAVIANMVQVENGDFRALRNDQIYKNTLLVGQTYRNALAQNLERLGYTIERKDKGLFDINEVPKELVETFSKRREEILDSLKARGLEPTTANSDLAALATRASKKPIERAELKAAWSAEVVRSGLSLDQAFPEPPRQKTEQQRDAAPAVEFAIADTAERASVYARDGIVMKALQHDPLSTSPAAVEKYIEHLIAEKVLYPVEIKGEQFLTDSQNIALEKVVLNQLRQGERSADVDVRTISEKMRRRSNDNALEARLSRSNLSDGQRAAVKLGLSSEAGRFVGVQGLAGTGKTFMLRTLTQYAEKAGYEVQGMAPTLKAVEALAQAVPGARTIASALLLAQHRGTVDPDKPSLLIIDEASMVSSEKLGEVMKMANRANYDRVVLVGDVKQLESVGAGAPFRLLQRNDMPTASMVDVIRQNTPEGREAVLHAYASEIHEAFARIAVPRQTEAGDDRQERRENIAKALAQDYLERAAPTRAVTGLIVLTNEMRGMINDAVQTGLRAEGTLTGTAIALDVLAPRNLTWAQRREAGSYQTGDIVTTVKPNAALGIEAQTLYTVANVDAGERTLTLSSPDGTRVDVSMGPDDRASSDFIVYTPQKQQLYAGDQVKFKITDRDHGVINAMTGTVVRVTDDEIRLRNDAGGMSVLPTDSMAVKGLQLAYASTAHDFQGSAIDQVVWGVDSGEKLVSEKSFYVAISRMREATQIYTDSTSKLIETIQKHTGDVPNALEALEHAGTSSTRPPARSEISRSETLETAPDLRRDDQNLTGVKRAESDPSERVQKEVETQAEKTLDAPEKNDPSQEPRQGEKADLSERPSGSQQEDLFTFLAKQLENQFERGDRERD